MKKIIIAGASGMVGAIIQRECLTSPDVAKVTSIVRRPSGITHPKLEEVVHTDFANFSSIKNHFSEQDVAHFCIGAYTGAVSDEVFKKITVDFALSFADAVKSGSPDATMCFLSGAGADPKEKSRVSFARYKGMAENYLTAKGFTALNIFRPAYIYPVEKRKEPNLMYSISRKLYPLMKRIYPSGAITSEQLGTAMFTAGMTAANHGILENEEIKKILIH